MTNRVQTVRSNVSGNRPTGRPPGELYVNWADGQIGTITPANAAQDLIPVRFFSTTANYVVGDFVVQTGQLYRAVAPSTPGAFKPANWSQIGGSITTGDVAPTTPQPGTLWWDSVGGQLYVWYTDANSSQWIIAVNTANFPSITVGATPPINPITGDMWWDSIGAQLYIRYADANSSQWVPTSNQLGGNFLPLSGGTLTGPVAYPGVTDGSNAAPGQIGEVITANPATVVSLTTGVMTNGTSILLSPGDWDVRGSVSFGATQAAANTQAVNISLTSAASPNNPPINGAAHTVSGPTNLGAATFPVGPVAFSFSVATNVYLNAMSNFTAGTSAINTASWIQARRVR